RFGHANGQLALALARIDRIEQHVGYRAGERVVIPQYHRKALGDGQIQRHCRGDRRCRGVSHQFADIYPRRRSFGQATELREAARSALQPLRFDRENFHRFRELGWRAAAETIDGETNRGQRILELVRNLTCALAKSSQAFRFDGALTPQIERDRGHLESLSEYLEFRRAAPSRRRWQLLTASYQLGPVHQLIDRPAQLPAQMSRNARRAESDRCQNNDDDTTTTSAPR